VEREWVATFFRSTLTFFGFIFIGRKSIARDFRPMKMHFRRMLRNFVLMKSEPKWRAIPRFCRDMACHVRHVKLRFCFLTLACRISRRTWQAMSLRGLSRNLVSSLPNFRSRSPEAKWGRPETHGGVTPYFTNFAWPHAPRSPELRAPPFHIYWRRPAVVSLKPMSNKIS